MLLFLCLLGTVAATAPGSDGSLQNQAIRDKLEQEAKQYLYRFGYISAPKTKGEDKTFEPSKVDLMNGLQRFQKEFLYFQSGAIDVPTQAKFDEYRCGNRDMFQGLPLEDLPKSDLWGKKTISYFLKNNPSSLSLSQSREAVDEAFEKWRKSTGLNFVEATSEASADIVISFEDMKDPFLNVAAVASKPVKSQIVLDNKRLWGYRNHLPRGISLFHALLHEIGHTLGLHHSFYRGSVMHPILKPALVPFGTLDDVPNIDRIAFRRLYTNTPLFDMLPPLPFLLSVAVHGLAETLGPHNPTLSPDLTPAGCPKYIDSVSAVQENDWIVFRGDKVYQVRNRQFSDRGRRIQDVFPKGPQFVNATVVSNGLTLLFTERTIYGYEFDGVSFNEARNFPRELHDRVLFYPQGAFPLNNGSVVLLSGNVFATYNVVENVPSLLNDKTRFFPNMPADTRSGIPKEGSDNFWIFDESSVTDYDMASKQVQGVQLVSDFFRC